MAVHTEYRPMPAIGPIERALRALIVIVVCVAFATAAAIGGFEYGRRSRPSDADIAAQRSTAIHAAVQRAVAAKGSADHRKRLRIERRALAAQRSRLLALTEQRVNAAHIADAQQTARAFRRGRATAKAGKAGKRH
jgi:uncharacterized membrane protein